MVKKGKFFLALYNSITKHFVGHGIKQKLPFLLPIFRYVKSQARTDFTYVQGHKMFLDSCDSLQLSINEIYEPIETNFVKDKIKEKNIVLDIGANIGYYTLIFAKLVGNNGKVFAFEPEPDNFRLLKKNVEINDFQNVVLENIALSDSNKKTKLYLCEDNKGMHRTYPSTYCTSDYIEVETKTLDGYFKNNSSINKISLIKMDIEGYELYVLKGMEKLLSQNKKLILLLEFVPTYIKESKHDPKEMIKFLIEKRFKIYFVNNNNKKIELMNKTEDLITRYSGNDENKNPRATSLICIRE